MKLHLYYVMSKSIFNTGKGGELLPATADVLGGIKVGTNLSITGDGVLSATVQSGSGGTVTSVTTTQDDVNALGISHTVSSTAPVITLKRPFNSLSDEFILDDSAPLPADKRVLRSRKATTSSSGTVVVPVTSGLTVNGSGSLDVNVDGTTITKDPSTGVLSGASTYTLPTATASVLGGIKVGSGLAIASGVLSATAQTPSDATTTTKGIVQVTEGNGLAISSGVLSKGTLQSYASGSGGISISGNTISGAGVGNAAAYGFVAGLSAAVTGQNNTTPATIVFNTTSGTNGIGNAQFNTSTGVFTPNLAGYYSVKANINVTNNAPSSYLYTASIMRNSTIMYTANVTTTSNNNGVSDIILFGTVAMNGSTDTLSVKVNVDNSSHTYTINNGVLTSFEAFGYYANLTSAATASANGYLTSTDWSTFNNKQPAISNATSTEIGYLSGVTSGIQTQLNSKQATISNATSTEIGYLSGVTSGIQTQLNSKQATISNATSTEIGYLSGVTSGIQAQLNGKLSSATGAASTIISLPLDQNRMLMSENVVGGKVITSNLIPFQGGGNANDSLKAYSFEAVSFDTSIQGTSAVPQNITLAGPRANVINIGTTCNSSGTNTDGPNTINIGKSTSTVNILGNTTYYNVSQLQVKDPLVTVNKDGTSVTSAAGCGLEIEESSAITGYVKTSTDRNNWLFKAPGKAGVLTVPMLDADSTVGGYGSGQQTETVLKTLPTLAATTVTYKASSGGATGSKTFTVTSASALGNVTAVQYGYFLYVQKQNVAGATLTGTGLGIPPLIINLCKSVTITGTDIDLELVVALTAQASGTYTLVKAESYTIPASVNYINVEMVGGGGGGGGGYTGNTPYIGSGGGAGCYARGKLAVTAGTTYYYSIGAGGAASASNTATNTSAGYGRPTMFTNASMSQYFWVFGGEGGNTPTLNTSAIPGAGESYLSSLGFTDLLSVGGGDATWHGPISSNIKVAGSGGNSFFGGGGRGAMDNPLAANSGKAYGAGGGGGRNVDAAADGAQGVLCIKYLSNTFLSTVYTPQAPLSFSGSNLVFDRTISSGAAITYAASPATNGPIFEFTSIPSYVKRITVMYKDLKHTSSGGSDFIIQLGTSSAYFTTATYRTNLSLINSGYGQGGSATATGFSLMTTVTSSNILHGTITLTLLDGNTWCCTGITSYIDTGAQCFSSGNVVLNGQLSKLKIMNTAAANCYGTVNIMYE
jgi:hypothetical protein